MDLSFAPQDLLVIGFLVFMEGILSIDNALVLAILARSLPQHEQRKALTYGLIGAITFRIAAILLAGYLIQWVWVKFVGGGYLLWIGLSHLYKKWRHQNSEDSPHASNSKKIRGFWQTVLIIELTDVAFAVDSILAAVALTPKYHLIIIGGTLGLIMMRIAASAFIKLLDQFPHFEQTAYLLVTLIGGKVILEGLHLPGWDFHSISNPAFWVFWSLMLLFVATGFLPDRDKKT